MQGAAARGLHKFLREIPIDERDLMPTCINNNKAAVGERCNWRCWADAEDSAEERASKVST